ncbi:MAG: phenylalanine--tRNA ligase subunit alpha [Candidatus Cloacimonetes bacterium]|nr:phenylalanine--tRNA ligase subunit alpha [Candidatus Cloacimonadota bacterium]
MTAELEQIFRQALQDIRDASTLHDLQQVKARYLGKKSLIMALLRQLGSVPPEERPAFGKAVNEAKQKVADLIEEHQLLLQEKLYKSELAASQIDITMPGKRSGKGSLHPITLAWQEIEDIFLSMGFDIAEGPDIEDEFHNFDALNTPADHPARNLSDTFYIDNDVLLRTQTSTVQIRVMEKFKPPIRIISPGSCYRNENDASHSPMFHQVEALVVDVGVTFLQLRDVLQEFVRRMFGETIDTRFRPHYFPFTEPSAELDIRCVKCLGTGCNLCKGSGWLEMGGAGMVDPNVFQMIGIDPEKFTGYAFGLGIDRIAMVKYNIPDMRLLFENDVRFLKQFR